MASIRKTDSGRWQARISMKGKAHSIGTFSTKKEAAEAAAKFEDELKPKLILEDVGELLQKDLGKWQQLLDKYEGTQRTMIELHIDRIESSIKQYKNLKAEKEKEDIKKLPSFNIF